MLNILYCLEIVREWPLNRDEGKFVTTRKPTFQGAVGSASMKTDRAAGKSAARDKGQQNTDKVFYMAR